MGLENLPNRTVESFAKLAGLRGVGGTFEWRAEEKSYYANGEKCGQSVHGLYEWLNRQPGVKP